MLSRLDLSRSEDDTQVICVVDDEDTARELYECVRQVVKELPVKLVSLIGRKLFGSVTGSIVIGTPAPVSRALGGIVSFEMRNVGLLLMVQREPESAGKGRYDCQVRRVLVLAC